MATWPRGLGRGRTGAWQEEDARRAWRTRARTEGARGATGRPGTDRGGEVSKRAGGERAWPPTRRATSSAGPGGGRARAGVRGLSGCPRAAPPDFIRAPGHTPSAFPARGGGSRAGAPRPALAGWGRCPESLQPRLHVAKSFFLSKEGGNAAWIGSPRVQSPNPGRDGGEKRSALDPLPYLPSKAPRSPDPLDTRYLLSRLPTLRVRAPSTLIPVFPEPTQECKSRRFGSGGISRISTHDPKTERQCPHTPLILVSNLPQGLGNQIHSCLAPWGKSTPLHWREVPTSSALDVCLPTDPSEREVKMTLKCTVPPLRLAQLQGAPFLW